MGADLCLAYLVIDGEAVPDFKAMRDVVAEMPLDRLRDVESFEMSDDPRAAAAAAVAEIERFWVEPDRNDDMIEVRGVTLMVTGGTSWGDSPSDAFDAFADIQRLPEVLEAGGFDL